jgi:hypothetical protein
MEDLSTGTNMDGKGYFILPSFSSSSAGISTRVHNRTKKNLLPSPITHLKFILEYPYLSTLKTDLSTKPIISSMVLNVPSTFSVL